MLICSGLLSMRGSEQVGSDRPWSFLGSGTSGDLTVTKPAWGRGEGLAGE